VQSTYPPADALKKTVHNKYENSYMFRHRIAILRETRIEKKEYKPQHVTVGITLPLLKRLKCLNSKECKKLMGVIITVL
jgi:hypothetical protein